MKTLLRLKFDDSIVKELLQCCACVGACRSRGRGRTGDAPWCPALRRDSSPDIASPSSPSTLREWSRTTFLPTGTTPSHLCLSWVVTYKAGCKVSSGMSSAGFICWVSFYFGRVSILICDCLFCGCL